MSTNSTSGTAGPALSFSGLGSGIDTASIVAALMKLERAPIDRINADKKELTQKQGVVQEINGLLGKLRDASSAMYAPGALAGRPDHHAPLMLRLRHRGGDAGDFAQLILNAQLLALGVLFRFQTFQIFAESS